MINKTFIKRVLIATGMLSLILLIVLGIHIYQVTRPAKADENTIAMARIDFLEDLNSNDSVKITNWLTTQNGVERVLCNPAGKTVVFSFYPVKVNATLLAKTLTSELNLKGERFLPDALAMKSGCPVQ